MTLLAEKLRTWEAWHHVHQPFELDWWSTKLAEGHSCDDTQFTEMWREAKEFIKPTGIVLDIGSGPRPPFAPCIVIDPLANEYRKITPQAWWNDVVVHAVPAEHFIKDLFAHTIICWNCLDHTIGWKTILGNMVGYGDASTRYAVATDFFEPFIGHPGFERVEFMQEINKHFTVIDRREPLGRELALLMVAK